MEDTETVNKLLANLNEVTESLSSKLKGDLLGKTLKEKIDEIVRDGELEQNEAVSELEQAKLLNMYSYILVSIYFTSLKLNGSKFNNESPIMFEIKRVKEYMDRVKKAQESLYKIGEQEKEKEIESAKFINKHLHEPAVSSAHFQDRDGKPRTKPEVQNKHEYFKDDEVESKLKQVVVDKSKKEHKQKSSSSKNKDKKEAKEKVKSGKISKPKKNKD